MELVPAGSTRGASAVKVPEFWLDRFEVTNRHYQDFVDAGGYGKPEFWQEPLVSDGKTLTWEQAMSVFRDKTGRPGPADWELGKYPEGKGDYPVTGVSWYEAAAYARFAGKRLPAYVEWQRAARTEWLYADALLVSNFSGKGLAPVGSYRGLDRFGTYDLFGNCKEWLWNEYRPGQRMVMGGAWDEAYYASMMTDEATPMERRANIGFRCARSAGSARRAAAARFPRDCIHPAGPRLQPGEARRRRDVRRLSQAVRLRSRAPRTRRPTRSTTAIRTGEKRRSASTRSTAGSASRPSCFCRGAAPLPTRR